MDENKSKRFQSIRLIRLNIKHSERLTEKKDIFIFHGCFVTKLPLAAYATVTVHVFIEETDFKFQGVNVLKCTIKTYFAVPHT